MKKLLLLLLCVATLIIAGCGDKFAKEKEAITKAEKAAMSMELPVPVRPEISKQPPPTKQEYTQYQEDLNRLIAAEKKMLAEMRKSDAQIAAMMNRAEEESEKKELRAFRDKVRQERINFVKKISRGRLCGDTFTVGVGNTWQEIEMVYGKPQGTGDNFPGTKRYIYKGLQFEDIIGGGVPSPERLKKWVSRTVQSVTLTGKNVSSDAGVRIGMTRDEVYRVLKSKYVKKNQRLTTNELKIEQAGKADGFDAVTQFAMQDTHPYNLFLEFKKGRLARYIIAQN